MHQEMDCGNVKGRHNVEGRSQQFNFFSREIFHLDRHHQTLFILYYVLYNYVLYIIKYYKCEVFKKHVQET